MLGEGRKGADSDVLVSLDLISAALLPVLGFRRNLMLTQTAQRVRNGALYGIDGTTHSTGGAKQKYKTWGNNASSRGGYHRWEGKDVQEKKRGTAVDNGDISNSKMVASHKYTTYIYVGGGIMSTTNNVSRGSSARIAASHHRITDNRRGGRLACTCL